MDTGAPSRKFRDSGGARCNPFVTGTTFARNTIAQEIDAIEGQREELPGRMEPGGERPPGGGLDDDYRDLLGPDRRRRISPKASSPAPENVRVAGSGTSVSPCISVNRTWTPVGFGSTPAALLTTIDKVFQPLWKSE